MDHRKEGDTEKEALTELIDRIATLNPLSLPADRSDLAKRRILRPEVRGGDWVLHAEKGGVKNETYQSLVDSLFAEIRTIDRHTDKREGTNEGYGILYFRQIIYSIHPSKPFTYNSTKTSAFHKQQSNGTTQTDPVGNRCFNYCKPGYSVCKCSKPHDNERIKWNVNQWKKPIGLKQSSINFLTINELVLEEDELSEVFMVTLIFENATQTDEASQDTTSASDINFSMKYTDDYHDILWMYDNIHTNLSEQHVKSNDDNGHEIN